MAFVSGMSGISGDIGVIGKDMVRCADQSYIAACGRGLWRLFSAGTFTFESAVRPLTRFDGRTGKGELHW
jgi:hypothetical protein